MFSILGFAWLACLGEPNVVVLGVVIAFEALGIGLGTVAYVAFIARATDPRYTATQFAFFTSFPRSRARSSTRRRLDRGADGLVQLFPVVYVARGAGNGITLACCTMA